MAVRLSHVKGAYVPCVLCISQIIALAYNRNHVGKSLKGEPTYMSDSFAQSTRQASRDDLIRRAQALAAMSRANGCSEAEAATAFAMLQALRTKHAIGDDEMSVRRESADILQDSFSIIEEHFADWGPWALGPIQGLLSVRCRIASAYKDALGLGFATRTVEIKFFGYPADVAAALAMAEIIHTAIATTTIVWSKSTKTKGKAKLQSFHIGMAQRLGERINELKPKAQANSQGALIVLKDQLVTAAYAKEFGTGGSTLRANQVKDSASAAAGRARADNVRLGHASEVSGARRALPAQ